MKQKPQVVSFNQSSAYAHHRAMVNRRENNPVDALELMRQAVERAPENVEYRLDLAELYCEMGCHEQSSRLLLDMLSRRGAPAECYYGLALNQMGMNDLDGARRSLRLYRRADPDGAREGEAGRLAAEIEIYDTMNRPVSRKLGRAMRVADRACELLREGELAEARRAFERSLSMASEQYEMRALYALTLMLMGDGEAALKQAERAEKGFPPSVKAVCVSAQVYFALNQKQRAEEALHRVTDERPEGAELQLLIHSMSIVGMDEEIAECARLALQITPFDRVLLHQRAVALHRLGRPDAEVQKFWLRILRIDPEDDVARYYQQAAANGELGQCEPDYAYQVPDAEFRARFHRLAERVGGNLGEVRRHWREDGELRRLVRWAASSGDGRLKRIALTIVAAIDDAEAESLVRAMMFGSDLEPEMKMHIAAILKLRGADMREMLPNDGDLDSVILPDAEPLLEGLPVGERQLIRYAGEVLEDEWDVSAPAALAVLWARYRQGRGTNYDPIMSTDAGAAALVYSYLALHGKRPSLERAARRFGCSVRRLAFYAGRIVSTLEEDEGETDE